MSNGRFEVRQEVLNVLLADLLERRGPGSIPESIRRRVGEHHRLPNITLAGLWGVRFIIEGRILDNDGDRQSLLRDARRRVEEGLCPICLAVLYPPELRGGRSLPTLTRSLEQASLEVRVISEGHDGAWARM